MIPKFSIKEIRDNPSLLGDFLQFYASTLNNPVSKPLALFPLRYDMSPLLNKLLVGLNQQITNGFKLNLGEILYGPYGGSFFSELDSYLQQIQTDHLYTDEGFNFDWIRPNEGFIAAYKINLESLGNRILWLSFENELGSDDFRLLYVLGYIERYELRTRAYEQENVPSSVNLADLFDFLLGYVYGAEDWLVEPLEQGSHPDAPSDGVDTLDLMIVQNKPSTIQTIKDMNGKNWAVDYFGKIDWTMLKELI